MHIYTVVWTYKGCEFKSMPNHELAVMFLLLGNDCIILRECTCTMMVYNVQYTNTHIYIFISLWVFFCWCCCYCFSFALDFGFIFIELKNIIYKVLFVDFVFVSCSQCCIFSYGKFWDGRICWWFKITLQTTFYLAAEICLPCHICYSLQWWSFPWIWPNVNCFVP